MKEKQAACLVLIILIAVFAFGTQKVYKLKSGASTKAADNSAAAETAKQLFTMSQGALSRLKTSTKEVRDFHTEWEQHFNATANWQTTESRILDSIRHNVFGEKQRFELLENKDNPFIKQTLRGHLILQDEYSKVLNWLGGLEESFPTSRITSCIITRGTAGDNIKVELIVDIPITGKST
ncbi:MAG: hypothetical protein ACI8UO_001067 [Verrucomicrobiales bacterium]|jgi:hypothetical protein